MQLVYAGKICRHCSRTLPDRTDGRSGERTCDVCVSARLCSVDLSFGKRGDLVHASFVDSKTQRPLPWRGIFATEQKLYDLVRASYEPASAERTLETALVARGHGSCRLRITPEQYERLTRPNPKHGAPVERARHGREKD